MTAHQTEVATLAGGCFWCLDTVFRELNGVEKVESGYAGGQYPNPTYRDVCSGMTGHAEVVQVTFDPAVISFRDLLGVFFTIHDPTTLNRQGADVGHAVSVGGLLPLAGAARDGRAGDRRVEARARCGTIRSSRRCVAVQVLPGRDSITRTTSRRIRISRTARS